ncbi:MAG: type III-A CRISPR-associated RAMP protein Csm5 [Thermanaerothrix sp.]|uniref:type III-A CRISPR-associated RAMP protein Csm5 n=1 Tax=Thermanaerothrix sp. TaxID=2972675 RepID=UPI003C79985E
MVLMPLTLKITTLSPVHIGSGDRLISGVDYLIHGDSLVVISPDRLLRWIGARPDQERLVSILTTALANPKKGGIEEFLRQINYQIDLATIAAYKIKSNGYRPLEVFSFIKTLTSHPILPGSSLKGAIRSALLRGKVHEDTSLQRRIDSTLSREIEHFRSLIKNPEDRRKGPETKSEEIEGMVFVRDGINLNRLLQIRDSDPLDISRSLELHKVQLLSIREHHLGWKEKNSNYGNNPTTLYVEALRKNLTIELAATWQTYLLSETASELRSNNIEALFAYWVDYLRIASLNLLVQEQAFYSRYGQTDLANWYEARINEIANDSPAVILPLGWGGGYDAKTITDLLSEQTFRLVVESFRNTQGLGKPGRNPNAKWLGPLNSPKSRKVVVTQDNTLQPLGWVKVEIEYDAKAQEWFEQQQKRFSDKKPSLPALDDERVKYLPPLSGVESNIKKTTTSASIKPSHEQAPTPAPRPKTKEEKVIQHFSETPKVGDIFLGTYLDTDNGEALFEIPGLDVDTQAYAVVAQKDLPSFWHKSKPLKLRVVKVIQERTSYFKVLCEVVI